MSSELALKRI